MPSGKRRSKTSPRVPYWIDLVLAALLALGGVIIASADRGFVDLSAFGAGLVVSGVLLGGLDVGVLRGQLWALQVRTGIAFLVVLGAVASLLSKTPGTGGNWILLILALPNFVWFWVGLLHLTRRGAG